MRYWVKFVLSAVLFITIQEKCFAQLPEYYVKLLTEQQGLTAADFTSVEKDQRGFLWLVSQSAVHRFDGKQSWQFPIEGVAQKIFIDNKDRKWLMTRSGVYLFLNDHSGFLKIAHKSRSNLIPIHMYSVEDKVWLVLPTGLSLYDELKQNFNDRPECLVREKGDLNVAASNQKSLLFFSTRDSVFSLNLKTRKLLGFPVRQATSLIYLTENSVFVSTRKTETFYFNFQTGFSRKIDPREVDNTGKNAFLLLYNGVAMQNDLFLFSSNQGLLEFDVCRVRFRKPSFYYKGKVFENSNSIRELFRDQEGTVYMTHADGIAFCNPNAKSIGFIRQYNYKGVELPNIDIRCFAEEKDGSIWMGTLNGLANLNFRTGELKTLMASEQGDRINFPSIRHMIHFKGYLWIGTAAKGIWLYNSQSKQFKRPIFRDDSLGKKTEQSFLSEFIWKMQILDSARVFVAGGSHSFLIDANTLITTQVDQMLFPGISRSALLDSSGNLWHGTTNGLTCVDRNLVLKFRITDSFPDKRIGSFCEWKKNHILVGTKGLYEVVVEGQAVKSFRRIKAIPDNRFIYCMEKDELGRVWMGTEDGIFAYDPQTDQVEFYDAADNVQPQSFNTNGLFKASNGIFYAGGKSGMNFFDPLRIQRARLPLLPIVASFNFGKDDSSFFIKKASISIPYFERNISINLTVPDFNKPFKLLYRYKLHKDDSSWIFNGNSRYVQLNNLNAGKYSFLPSVSYDGRNWFDGKESVDFVIQTPWWRKPWFIGVCITLLGLVVFFLRRLVRLAKQRKQRQLAIDYFAKSGYEHSTVEEILWDITHNCISRLGFEECVIYLVDKERGLIVQKSAFGNKNPNSREIANPIAIPIGKGITGTVALTCRAEIVNDTSKDSRYIVDDERRLSEITVPIIHDGEVIAIIDSEARRKNFFHKVHLETLSTIASICSAKISRAMAIAEMKKAEHQLAELNSRMLETKYMNLRLQMNPHFLFNALNSIQHLIVSKQTNEAYKYLSIFSNFLRSVLQYSDKNVIKLEEELAVLDLYIKLELLGSDKSFDYRIEVDEQLDKEEIVVPPLIIQPLVENAIWHGLMNKIGDRLLHISFRDTGNDELICEIEDNGVGREIAAGIGKGSLNNLAYQSKSMALIEERLRILKAKTGLEASIEIEDKFSDGVATGTKVRLLIPSYNFKET